MAFFYRYFKYVYKRPNQVHAHLEDGTCPCGFNDATKLADECPEKYFYHKQHDGIWIIYPNNKTYAMNTFKPLSAIITCKRCRAFIEKNKIRFTVDFLIDNNQIIPRS